VLTSWGSTAWGIIVSWDWHTLAPIVTAWATVVYTVGTLLLWGTTRRSVRALESAVKLTFLQMLYEAKRPSAIDPFREPSTMGRYTVGRRHQQQYEAALRQVFPQLYGLVHAEEQTPVPEERQEGQ
jgi:hypothetical protein